MQYTYTRELQSDGRYNIGDLGQPISLARDIKNVFTSHTVSVKCTGNNVYVIISPDLTSGEKTTLDGIVTDHKASLGLAPSPFRCTETYNDPTNIDINFHNLYKEDVIDSKGSLIEKNYYTDFDGSTYSGLAIKDEMEYNILSNDLVSYRTETITWYREDDNIGLQKVLSPKYYIINGDPTEAIKEGIRRRSNLIDKAKAYGLSNIEGTHDETGEISMPNSHHFFILIKEEVEKYIDGTCKQCLVDRITNATEEYVTQQIKDDLENILDYWST